MPLATPNIASIFSIWTKSLQVTGALPTATITIKSIGQLPRDIASGIAQGGEDWISLLPKVSIMADDRLVVRQQLAGETSDWTPDPKAYIVTPVPASPQDFRPVEIASRLWECGEFILLRGAEPGALLEFSYGPVDPATANAPDGTARLQLASKLTKANPVSVKQVTPIGNSQPFNSTVAKVQALPIPQNVQLPPPTIRGTPLACETAVTVQDVFEGAVVELKRTSGGGEAGGFDLSALTFAKLRPFVEGEYVSAIQTMHKCERDGQESGAVKVGPAKAIQPAVGPLCVGGPGVTVFGLQPGATIHFEMNGIRYDLMPPAGATKYSFYLELTPGTATVTQEICGIVSPPTVAKIEEHPEITLKPIIRTPLYDCARLVRVTNICVGAEVQIFAETPTGIGPISERKICLSGIEDFYVIPPLKVNTFVWALATGCKQSNLESDHMRVDPHPPINSPEIEPQVESGATAVRVKWVIPTASVYVYLMKKDLITPIGYVPYAEGTETTVPLDNAVKTQDQLFAAQSYCAVTTENGPTIWVVKPKPLAPIIKVPAPGSIEVACEKLSISWEDPGAGTEQAADKFELELRDDSTLVASQSDLKTATFSATPNLKAGTKHEVSVRGSNSTGDGPWRKCTFITKAPKPNLTKFEPPTLTGTNFPKDPLNAEVRLHVRLEVPPNATLFTKEGLAVKFDNREKDLSQFHYDGGTGNFTASVDLVSLMDPLPASGGTGSGYITVIYAGPIKGEIVHITASYRTPSLGLISSAPFSYTWTKDAPIV